MKKNWAFCLVFLFIGLDVNAMMTASRAPTARMHLSRCGNFSYGFLKPQKPFKPMLARNFCATYTTLSHKDGGTFDPQALSDLSRRPSLAKQEQDSTLKEISARNKRAQSSADFISLEDLYIGLIGINLKDFASTLDFDDPAQLLSFFTAFHLLTWDMLNSAYNAAIYGTPSLSKRSENALYGLMNASHLRVATSDLLTIYESLELPKIDMLSTGDVRDVEFHVGTYYIGKGLISLSTCEEKLTALNFSEPQQIWDVVYLKILDDMADGKFLVLFKEFYLAILPAVAKASERHTSEQIRNTIELNLPSAKNPFANVMTSLFLTKRIDHPKDE